MTRRCYKVKEIKEMLGIGKNQTYELIKSKRFPVLKIGKHRCTRGTNKIK